MFNPLEKDVPALGEAMERGETTAADLVEYYLNRIELYDQQGPCLNAIVCINPNAIADAEKLDEERRAGKVRSKLHGIPIALKDNFDTFDMPTTAGSLPLKDSRPTKDAFVVSKLRQAGAVILAKTNLTEFARHGVTVGSLMGQTLNPYDLTRTPGGSSGGTGAALAANMAAVGMGTDTVNSVRSPSSANSLVGLRPTTGLLSRNGIVPCSSTQDMAGPLARTVTDIAILLDICAGYDSQDEKSAEQIGRCPDTYLTYLNKDGLRGRKIGLISNNLGNDTQVLAAVDRAISVLREQGAEIITLDVPEFETGRVIKECDVQLYETKPLLNAYFKSVLNCPVKDISDLVTSGKIHKSIHTDMNNCAMIENPLEQPAYKDKLLTIAKKRQLAYQIMALNGLDAFCYPHQQILVEPVVNQSQNGRNGILASVLGFPAITVPAGFSEPDANAVIGVPIGVEFMARPYEEPVLLEIAYGFEQNSRFRKPPVTTP